MSRRYISRPDEILIRPDELLYCKGDILIRIDDIRIRPDEILIRPDDTYELERYPTLFARALPKIACLLKTIMALRYNPHIAIVTFCKVCFKF